MERMKKIGDYVDTSGTIEVEAGVVLAVLHSRLSETDHIFPMHLGSEGSAQIGGLIATNAGGSHAFRFGMMQDLVLGLEVVLPDGSVFDGMRAVQKDNSGYQLRKQFCGSEGTLGIVTRAVLKLEPSPKQTVTSLLVLKSHQAAMELARRLKSQIGEFLTAMEFFSDSGVALALKNIPEFSFPLETRSSCSMLVEAQACSSRTPLPDILEEVLEDELSKERVLDGAIASSLQQALDFWRLREEQPEGQKREGPQLKHDISIPPARLAEYLDCAEEICSAILPGIRIDPFGHLGDGNVHFNLSPPLGASGFTGKDEELGREIYRIAVEMGGSYAAEHGIGRSKFELSKELRSSVENRLLNCLKLVFDQENQLNPGVLT